MKRSVFLHRVSTSSLGGPNPIFMSFVLTLGHGVKHIFNSGFFIILPELRTAMGLSNSAIGTLSTFRGIGNGLGNFPAGYLADRYNHHWRAILGFGILGVGVFHFLLGSVSHYWLLVAMASFGAMAISFWHPPAITALSQKFINRRGFALAIHGTGGSIGEALGPISTAVLLGFFIWRTVLQISIIPSVAMAILVGLGLKGLRGEFSHTHSFSMYINSVRGVLRHRAMIVVLVITGGFISAQTSFYTFLPIYLREDLGYSSLATSGFLSIAQVSGIISQPVMGFLSDRYSRKAVILPSMIMLGITIFAIPFTTNINTLLTTMMLMGAFNFPLMAIILAAALDISDDDVPATVVSLVFGATVVFSSLAPGIAGILADAINIKAAFYMSSGISFTTAGFALFSRMQRDIIQNIE